MGAVGAATAVALVALVVVGGCVAPAPSGSTGGDPVDRRAEDKGFLLTTHLPTSTFDAGTAIPLETMLTYTGPAPKATLRGSGSGPVSMSYTELTGAHRSMGGVMTADCAPHDFARGVPALVRPVKSWAASQNDPNHAFFVAWGDDPELHLPAGRWRIDVSAGGFLAECAADAPGLSLAIPIEITIR